MRRAGRAYGIYPATFHAIDAGESLVGGGLVDGSANRSGNPARLVPPPLARLQRVREGMGGGWGVANTRRGGVGQFDGGFLQVLHSSRRLQDYAPVAFGTKSGRPRDASLPLLSPERVVPRSQRRAYFQRREYFFGGSGKREECRLARTYPSTSKYRFLAPQEREQEKGGERGREHWVRVNASVDEGYDFLWRAHMEKVVAEILGAFVNRRVRLKGTTFCDCTCVCVCVCGGVRVRVLCVFDQYLPR